METAEQLKAELQRRGIRGLALDVDQTLSYTNEHWFDHLYEAHPPADIGRDDIRRQRFIDDVPEWKTPEARAFIHRTVHSNQFQETVPLIEGADSAVASIAAIVPIVAYITARPGTVRAGTLAWFRKHGFPKAALIMREFKRMSVETMEKDKNVWKASVLKKLWPEVTGIVDDNLVLAHELENVGYEGTLYLYGPQHEQFAGHPRVVVCPTWADVVASIKKSEV